MAWFMPISWDPKSTIGSEHDAVEWRDSFAIDGAAPVSGVYTEDAEVAQVWKDDGFSVTEV